LGQAEPTSPLPELTSIVGVAGSNNILMPGIAKEIGSFSFTFENEIYEKAQMNSLEVYIETGGGIVVENVRAYLRNDPQVRTEVGLMSTSTGEGVYRASLDLSSLRRSTTSPSVAELVLVADIHNVTDIAYLASIIRNVNDAFSYMTRYGPRSPSYPWGTAIEGIQYTN
jgi:hypothetical protein